MFTFFEGPEPSDGLRMKVLLSISSTDWDMIGGKASCDGGTLGRGSVTRSITEHKVTLLPEFLYD
jgi:hypothetical protein